MGSLQFAGLQCRKAQCLAGQRTVLATRGSKRFEPLLARYQPEEKEELSEYQAWDAAQIKRSTTRVGAADRRGGGQIGADAREYEMVMATEEQIDFVSDELIAGNLSVDGTAAAPPTARCSSRAA